MSDDDGGVDESLSSTARIALTVAIQLGEKLARAFQEAMREAQHRDAAQARELTARYDSERVAARQAVSVVNNPQWWDNASVRDVARVAETAAAWKTADPQIAQANAVIASEVRQRYGVDVASLRASGGGPTEVAMADAERAQVRRDLTEAQAMIAEADRLDRANDASMAGFAQDARAQAAVCSEDTVHLEATRSAGYPTGARDVGATAARAESEVAYDSSERRASTANAMRAQRVPEAQVTARMIVDASFASPAEGPSAIARDTVPRTRGGRKRGPVIERAGHAR